MKIILFVFVILLLISGCKYSSHIEPFNKSVSKIDIANEFIDLFFCIMFVRNIGKIQNPNIIKKSCVLKR